MSVFLLIAASAIVTILPRIIPLMVLSRLQLPDWLMKWLSYVPISVMAALVAQEVLVPGGSFSLFHNVELWAALITFWVAAKTRSLLGTVIAGVVIVMVLRFIV